MLGPESWGHTSTLEQEGPPCRRSPRTAVSPLHAQLLSGVLGRFQNQAGNCQSLVAAAGRCWPLSQAAILVSLPDRPALRPRASLGGQDAGLQPGPPYGHPKPSKNQAPQDACPLQPDIRTFSSELLHNIHTAPLRTFPRG